MPKLTPTYLTTDLQGAVTAFFSGGVKITAGLPLVNSPKRQIQWVTDDAAQVPIAVIAGTDFGRQGFTAGAQSPTTPTNQGFVTAQVDDGHANSTVGVLARSGANSASATLINSSRQSDYMQFGALGGRRSALIFPTFTWPGGQAQSNLVSLTATAGFTVSFIFSGQYDDNTGFVAIAVSKPAADILACLATINMSPVSPAAGVTSRCPILVVA